MGAWALAAIVVAVIGLTIEQTPPTKNPYVRTPDVGAGVAGAGAVVGAPVHNVGGTEGADVQLATGAHPTELGSATVGKNFKATTASITTLFKEVLGSKGR